MKKKSITYLLLAMLVVGLLMPLAAYATESWDYGYDPDAMQYYNDYYHSDYIHRSSMTKLGYTYWSLYRNPGDWALLTLDYTGPYLVTYDKHIY